MRILIIGKYPPIEGGVSSHTYWLARSLGEMSHEVSVVTNANLVEETYREVIPTNHHEAHQLRPKNVRVSSLEESAPMHIPYSEAYVTRLTNLGLQVIAERGADVIYAHYLEPYATAGYMLKHFTGVPLVVRHAGSDIYRLLRDKDFSLVLGRVLQRADALFLSRALKELSHSLGIPSRRVLPTLSRAVPDAFSPDGPAFAPKEFQKPEGVPLVTYLGKAGTNKGIMELLKALSEIEEDYRLLMVTQGTLLPEIQKTVEENPRLKERVWLSSFVAPWVVPSIMRASDLLVHLENRFPIPIHSPTQPFEAIMSATPLLLSEEMHKKITSLFPVNRDRFTVVKDPVDISDLKSVLKESFSNVSTLKENARSIQKEFAPKNDWSAHVEEYVKVFEKLSRRSLISRLWPFRR